VQYWLAGSLLGWQGSLKHDARFKTAAMSYTHVFSNPNVERGQRLLIAEAPNAKQQMVSPCACL